MRCGKRTRVIQRVEEVGFAGGKTIAYSGDAFFRAWATVEVIGSAEPGIFILKIGPCPFAERGVIVTFIAVMFGETDIQMASCR